MTHLPHKNLGVLPMRTALTLASLLMSAMTVQAQAPPSGMLLGINGFENYRGLRVTSTIPGYSAEGRIFAGDVLTRVSDGNQTFSARTFHSFEMAKDIIGPNRWASLELLRPGFGPVYLWVQFTPVNLVFPAPAGGQPAALQPGGVPLSGPIPGGLGQPLGNPGLGGPALGGQPLNGPLGGALIPGEVAAMENGAGPILQPGTQAKSLNQLRKGVKIMTDKERGGRRAKTLFELPKTEIPKNLKLPNQELVVPQSFFPKGRRR